MGITDRLKGKASVDRDRSAMPYNGKAILLSAIGGIIAAIVVIFIPISLLETIAGASGLSEIIPAARPPLGSSARALFIIFTAILVSSILLVLLLSFGRKKQNSDYDNDTEIFADQETKERHRMPITSSDEDIANKILEDDDAQYNQAYQQSSDESGAKKASIIGAVVGGGTAMAAGVKSIFSKLPFMGGDDSVRSFDDLPKLRNADSHPDAPPRRPLFANKDLGDENLVEEEVIDELPQDIDEHNNFSNFSDIVETSEIVEETQEDINIAQPIYEDADLPSEELMDNDAAEAEMAEYEQPYDQSATEDEDHHISYDEDVTKDSDIIEPQDEDVSELPSYDSLLGRLENVVERRRAYKERLLYQGQSQNVEQSPDRKPILNEGGDRSASKTEEYVEPEVQNIEAVDEVKETQQYADGPDNASEDIPSQPVNLKQVPSADEVSKSDDASPSISEGQTEEMDSALRAALETLHKMNEKSA